ncbi:alpha/beta fold hydrolase [Mesobacillus maritimus]|uniref:Alpha/beta hydrolase n=1 Tax=Mesobacillus maritimus TaxID=1643336 RepID=A0ABS7K6J3_9BACI|nr:alpha/beta hydrolase [Mesobacillus maritimus]MBY0097887.1 alpha/beta hydrolase [Mesobacillus maritimus]
MKNIILALEGKSLSYYVGGDPEKPTVICFHGLAGSSLYSFAQLANQLKEHFHLILIDQPGHGKSSPFEKEKDYTFSSLAKWYEKVFEFLQLNEFYLIGHSWGADVALHYAKQYPSKVKGVILLDGGFTFPVFQEEMTFQKAYNGWSTYMDNHAKFTSWREVVDEFKGYTKAWNTIHEQSLSSIFIKKVKYELISSKFTILSIIKAFFNEPFTSTYTHIKSPLLLVHATEPQELDEARNKGIAQIKQEIKNASIVSMENTGHMLQWDKPKEVGDEIIKWVQKN